MIRVAHSLANNWHRNIQLIEQISQTHPQHAKKFLTIVSTLYQHSIVLVLHIQKCSPTLNSTYKQFWSLISMDFMWDFYEIHQNQGLKLLDVALLLHIWVSNFRFREKYKNVISGIWSSHVDLVCFIRLGLGLTNSPF